MFKYTQFQLNSLWETDQFTSFLGRLIDFLTWLINFLTFMKIIHKCSPYNGQLEEYFE